MRAQAGTALVLGWLAIAGVAGRPAWGAERPDDATISDWVEEAIAADPRAQGDSIDVSTREGIVTLSGAVPTLAGRKYAVLDAQKIHGVLGVIDRLEVDVVNRPDEEVAGDVETRILNSPSIASEELRVESRGGSVRLIGRVASRSQRLQAELLASEVRGVRSVENALSARVGASRPDTEIKNDIVAALGRDAYLAGLPIRVVVESGTATLQGSVGSAYERQRAENQVWWIDGVEAVGNELVVEWWAERSTRMAQPTARQGDALADVVARELAQDARIDASDIQVDAVGGRVTLRGIASSLHQRRLAEEDAWNVVGVMWVGNELTVEAEQRPDGDIERTLTRALAGDSLLYDAVIGVSVEDGRVRLSGDVPAAYHRAQAGAIASRIRGVKELENQLRVVGRRTVSDAALAGEVTQRLGRHWRTAPVVGRISIDVQEGVVTLRGEVDRWSERRSAGRIAATTPGVARVRNRLAVGPALQLPESDAEGEGLPEAPGWEPYYFDHPILPWIV